MNKVDIYTDGACSGNPGIGGWGAILQSNGQTKELSGGEMESTNNKMELTAPIEALSSLSAKCKVDLFSDSSYVVNGFEKGWVKSWIKRGWRTASGDEVKNIELWKRLDQLCEMHDVTWHKVKGHSDNVNNNRCDVLATSYVKKLKEGKSGQVVVGVEKAARRSEIYDGSLTEKVLNNKLIYKGHIFTVETLDVELPTGKIVNREVIRHNGGAAVVALDEDGCMYVVHQFRVALERETIEIPAGKLDFGEDPLICARRELLEETGLMAKEIKPLLEMNTTPGFCNERLYLYIATGLSQAKPDYDPDEYIKCEKLPVDQLLKMIFEGKITDSKTIIGILAIKNITK